MSSPRKSSRNRSRISYVELVGYGSDEDDFIIDGPEILKTSKRRKELRSDDECTVNAPPTALPLKLDDKTKSPNLAAVQNKGRSRTRNPASNPADVTPQPLTKQPLLSVPGITPFSNTEPGTEKTRSPLQAKHLNDLPSSIEPLTPLNSTPTLVCVTPSSALRLGLSRKNIRKTLHPNIRLSR